jgi:hypothetical protein
MNKKIYYQNLRKISYCLQFISRRNISFFKFSHSNFYNPDNNQRQYQEYLHNTHNPNGNSESSRKSISHIDIKATDSFIS